jgi:hypothetical protein
MTTISIYTNAKGETQIMSRGRGNGLDTKRATIVEATEAGLVLRVPGHREASGYDRNRVGGPTSHVYIPASTHRFSILSQTIDRWGGVFRTLEAV